MMILGFLLIEFLKFNTIRREASISTVTPCKNHQQMAGDGSPGKGYDAILVKFGKASHQHYLKLEKSRVDFSDGRIWVAGALSVIKFRSPDTQHHMQKSISCLT